MQKVIAAILLLALFGQTFGQGIYYLDYLVDKAAYAKNCINKAKPKMRCNGKCQLMKKIQEEEKKQQQAPEMKLASKMEVISSKSWFATFLSPVVVEFSQYCFNYNTGIPIDRPSPVFHPPGA